MTPLDTGKYVLANLFKARRLSDVLANAAASLDVKCRKQARVITLLREHVLEAEEIRTSFAELVAEHNEAVHAHLKKELALWENERWGEIGKLLREIKE